jgi:hypothetical protein
LIFIKTDLVALNSRVSRLLDEKTPSLNKLSKAQPGWYFLDGWKPAFHAFADGASSAMAAKLTKDISARQRFITRHGSRRYSRPESCEKF